MTFHPLPIPAAFILSTSATPLRSAHPASAPRGPPLAPLRFQVGKTSFGKLSELLKRAEPPRARQPPQARSSPVDPFL